MLNTQLGLGSEARRMKVSIINTIKGNISHENTFNNLRECVLKREGDLGKEVIREIPVCTIWVKRRKEQQKQKSISRDA